MISLYRWQPGQVHGTWVDLPELPADGRIPPGEVWWLDLDDPSAEEEAIVFNNFLKVHPLTLEDATRPRRVADGAAHLPKVEEFPDYLFVIANPLAVSVKPGEEDGPFQVTVQQLSAVLTHQVLVTHHYQPLPSVTECKQFLYRHAEQAGRGPDYLFHRILDEIVDDFAPAIDRIVDRLEEIEVTMFVTPSRELLTDLIHLKRAVIALRKTLILQREVLARLMRGEFALVDEREIAYYRNVFDHLVRYTELIEGAREMVSDLMQTHLAVVSNQLNGIMKTLTMFSIVGVVCTLIAGVYGMNFENMPETKWQYGYYYALGLMAVAALAMLGVFRWKKWI
jgi:magnesium transporter